MKYALLAARLEAADLPLLAVAVPKGERKAPAPLAALDAKTGGLLARAWDRSMQLMQGRRMRCRSAALARPGAAAGDACD